MTELIKGQLFIILVMCGFGITMMMIFQIRNLILKRLGHKKRLKIFIYFFSWVCMAYMFSQFLYYCAHGVITFYALGATAIGIILWKKFFYDIITGENTYEEEQKEKEKIK